MAGGGGGANAYWPGFVDALTNVVIAMIFVVVVLAISLSFAAQMMGHKMAQRLIQEHEAKAVAATASAAAAGQGAAVEQEPTRLRGQTRIAVAGNEKPKAASTLQTQSNFLELDYAEGALTLDAPAAEQLRAAVGPSSKAPRSRYIELVASGPLMFATESQRAAYLRVMAVRNQMLELGYAPDHIKVRIDSSASPEQAQVKVLITEQ
jgi:hypothetical protein